MDFNVPHINSALCDQLHTPNSSYVIQRGDLVRLVDFVDTLSIDSTFVYSFVEKNLFSLAERIAQEIRLLQQQNVVDEKGV